MAWGDYENKVMGKGIFEKRDNEKMEDQVASHHLEVTYKPNIKFRFQPWYSITRNYTHYVFIWAKMHPLPQI